MNRLTQKDEQGNWCLRGLRWDDLREGKVITRKTYERLYGALHLLMEYEETGLNPEQIQEMDWLYAEDNLGCGKGKIPVKRALPEIELPKAAREHLMNRFMKTM